MLAIDYPAKKVCLFTAANAPSEFDAITGTHGSISNGRFLLPMTSNTFVSHRMLFDTGTGEMGVVVNEASWKSLTGISDISKAKFALKESSWGTTIDFHGAYTKRPVKIGKLEIAGARVFMRVGAHSSILQPSCDGVLGNPLFDDGLVVLDLSAQAWFGFVHQDRPPNSISLVKCQVPCDSIEQRIWRFTAARDAIAQLRKQLETV